MTCNLATCQAEATHRYIPGWRCAAHAPAALAGRTEAIPDEAATLVGLRRQAGLPDYLWGGPSTVFPPRTTPILPPTLPPQLLDPSRAVWVEIPLRIFGRARR